MKSRNLTFEDIFFVDFKDIDEVQKTLERINEIAENKEYSTDFKAGILICQLFNNEKK